MWFKEWLTEKENIWKVWIIATITIRKILEKTKGYQMNMGILVDEISVKQLILQNIILEFIISISRAFYVFRKSELFQINFRANCSLSFIVYLFSLSILFSYKILNVSRIPFKLFKSFIYVKKSKIKNQLFCFLIIIYTLQPLEEINAR